MEKQRALCNKESYVKRIIPQINWDFIDTDYFENKSIAPFNLRKHYGYIGTFTPALPYSLIEMLTKPNAIVLDPFLGIGTTYLQALILDRKPIGIESCHAAVQVFTSFIYILKNYNKLAVIIQEWNDIKFSYKIDNCYNITNFSHEFLLLEPWYHPQTFNQLCHVKEQLGLSNSEGLNALMKIVLSSSLVRLSSQNKGWGYIADNVKPKPSDLKEKNLFKTLDSKIESLIKDIYHLTKAIPKSRLEFLPQENTIIQSSIFDCEDIDDASIDTIITSPPYPNMMDYARSQRLTYYFWGLPFDEDIKNEFASRRKRNNKDAMAEYVKLMSTVNTVLLTMLKANGYLCYTLPLFSKDEKKHEVINKVLNNLKEQGASETARFIRSISPTKRMNNTSLASLDKELVVLFRKE